jgi:hypothetical protein
MEQHTGCGRKQRKGQAYKSGKIREGGVTIREGGVAMTNYNEAQATEGSGVQITQGGVAVSGSGTMLPTLESGADKFDGEQFQTGAEEDDGNRQHFQTDEPDWEHVGHP